MSKPSKTNKTNKTATSTPKTNKAKTTKASVGRPRFVPDIPKGKFTMRQFCELNGVNPDTGKGEKCSKLTLIKFMARDAKRKGMSEIVRLKDETRNPAGEKGLGRKAFVFQLRSKFAKANATVNVPIVDVTPAPVDAPVADSTPVSADAPVADPVTA